MTILFITTSIFVLIFGTAWMIQNFPIRRKMSDYQRGYMAGTQDGFCQGIQRGRQLSEPATLHVFQQSK